MRLAPYTAFGKTLEVKVEIYVNGVYVDDNPQWDEELWIERGEDWYAFESMKGKRVRVIKREEWLRASKRAKHEN